MLVLTCPIWICLELILSLQCHIQCSLCCARVICSYDCLSQSAREILCLYMFVNKHHTAECSLTYPHYHCPWLYSSPLAARLLGNALTDCVAFSTQHPPLYQTVVQHHDTDSGRRWHIPSSNGDQWLCLHESGHVWRTIIKFCSTILRNCGHVTYPHSFHSNVTQRDVVPASAPSVRETAVPPSQCDGIPTKSRVSSYDVGSAISFRAALDHPRRC